MTGGSGMGAARPIPVLASYLPTGNVPRLARAAVPPIAEAQESAFRVPRGADCLPCRSVATTTATAYKTSWSSSAAAPPIVAGLVIDRATVPTCRLCCRLSPGKLVIDGGPLPCCPRAARAVDRRRAAHRPGNGPHAPPVLSIVAGLLIDRATVPTCRPCCRSSPGKLVIDRATVATCRPCCRSSPAWSSTGDPCHAAHVPPVLSIVAGLVIDRGPLPCCPRAARAVDRRRASWSSTGQRSPRATRGVDRLRPGQSTGQRVEGLPRGRLARGADRRRAGHRPGNMSGAFPAAVPPVASIVARAGHRPGTVAALPPCRPCCRSSPVRSSTGDHCHAAAAPPVLSIVGGQASHRPGNGPHVSPAVPIVAGLVID